MSDKRVLILLFAIMTTVAVAVGGMSLGVLYRAELDSERRSLQRAVQLQAELLQRRGSASPADWSTEPADSIRLHRLLGERGTLAIARRAGETVVFVDNPWVPGTVAPRSAPFDADATAAMRAALLGETGAVTVQDGSGNALMAVHAPVEGLGLGVVASRDLADFRRHFVELALYVGAVALALILLGTSAFLLVSRRLMRRLNDSEARFRELFETMRGGVAVYRACGDGEDFVLTGFNRAAERIDGTPRDEVLGRRLTEAFPGMQQTRLFEVLRRVWRSGQPEHVPAAFYESARGSGWRENHVYRLPSGEVVSLFEDVSDRRRAEEALKESEARWRSIIETHAQAIVIVDQKHEIRFVNKAAETLFGHSAQELIGAPFGFPLVQDDVAEIEIIRPGRSIAFGEMRAIAMRWAGQDNFLLFIQDVSAHKRAEGDLRKMFLAMEQSPASVMITDVNGRIEYVNPKFTETTGYTYPEVVGKTPGFLKSGYTTPRDYQELWKQISAGNVWRGEFHNRRKNGELFWELASIAPVRDGRGKVTHYVAVKEDISDRKATEERLRRSQRMEMIGQLTGGIAHDFNNLLAIILGNLQLLEEAPGLGPEHRELIADAIWSAERGAQLTHRLLAFARRQRLNPKVTDINHVVSEMAGLLRRTLGERIEVREVLAPGVWETMIDRGQLESALLNLVVNARDAMPQGVLTIATGTAVLPRDLETRGEDVPPGDYVVLSVADTGTGMAPEVLERIFEPFFTTKKFGEGSGLGLSMVYGFVRQSGGHITVESMLQQGTTVRLYLPRAAGGSEIDDAQARRRADRRLAGGEVILVVEDDARVRKTATNILRRQGYQVVEAGDAGEALEAVDRLQRLDLVFTDVVLANGMNGSELAHQVLCRRPETRILLTSGYAQQIPVVDGLFGDGIDLLPKPYRRRDLTAKVRDLLDRLS